MIDLHCHILADVDDGAASLRESLKMAAKAVADGIRALVATPHVCNGVYNCSAGDIAQKVETLNAELDRAAIPLAVYPGAEVHLTRGICASLAKGQVATINNSRYILLELPPALLPAACSNEIFSLVNHGFIPVIAHPERHVYLQRNPDYLATLVQMGALAQVTAQSLLGVFGRAARDASEHMLQYRLAHVIASDAHSAEERGPELRSAVSAAARLLGSRAKAEQMVTTVPAAIIADSNVLVEQPEIQEKGRMNKIWNRGERSLFSSISNFMNS